MPNPSYSLRTSRTFKRRRTVDSAGGVLRVPWNLLWDLQRIRPGIIVSSEMGPRTLQAWVYAKLHRVPLVVWAKLSEHTERKRCPRVVRIRRFLFGQAAGVIVNGASGEAYVRRIAPAVRRVGRIPYTTDLDRFAPPQAKSLQELPRLLTVGQWIDRKGLLPFAHALEQWLDRHGSSRLQWTLVGAGPLENFLRSREWHPRLEVTLRGQVAYDDLPALFHEHTLFAFPTLEDEWGVVVMEAMAAGLPVLGSVYSEAVNELVEHGVSGWHFDPSASPESLQTTLDAAILASPERALEMGRHGRKQVYNFTPEILARRFAGFLGQCAEGK